ncbi:hypothetical protein [Methylobacterium sp. GXF4]|uniref:hypothetical protein n=1 Tax=Methylobacterium sp. GXF4 TaxID=1096546 RepID=UPI0002D467C7|nr:hypothetical protein [Methylobacterium sp. GXF4]
MVAHPAFREIPRSLFPLTSAEAQAEYDALARLLFDAGRFTANAHRSLSSYAMQFDTITRAAASGKQVRGSWFAQLDKARKELGLDDLDRPIAAPQGARVNRYARTGFANRR